MIRIISIIVREQSAPIALFIAIFLLMTTTTVVAGDDSLSYGMSKSEAYDAKGVPDKTNRMPGEVGKEMWVYRCENDDGINEDCLYLYFDGEKLVKIERL